MSRSNYSDDLDQWDLIRWRGAVKSAIRGKRGQTFLREMIDSLDAMPHKRLIAHELMEDGDVCAIGSVGVSRGVDMTRVNVEDGDQIAEMFGVANALVREVEYMNDEGVYRPETPEERWVRMRAWVEAQIEVTG